MAMKYLLAAAMAAVSFAGPPSVGETAPDFALASSRGKTVSLSSLRGQDVVLVVLRGYPGYQCPYCQRQVREFVKNASSFPKARVVFVYPGPPAKGAEFMEQTAFPAAFELLLDPDYKFTTQYGLRWNAEGETAYPSTFLIDKEGKVFFAKSARAHAGRATVAEILEMLKQR